MLIEFKEMKRRTSRPPVEEDADHKLGVSASKYSPQPHFDYCLEYQAAYLKLRASLRDLPACMRRQRTLLSCHNAYAIFIAATPELNNDHARSRTCVFSTVHDFTILAAGQAQPAAVEHRSRSLQFRSRGST